MSRREDPYRSRPGESDADYLARIAPLEAKDRERQAEETARYHRSPDYLRHMINEAETVNDLRAVLLLVCDALEHGQ